MSVHSVMDQSGSNVWVYNKVKRILKFCVNFCWAFSDGIWYCPSLHAWALWFMIGHVQWVGFTNLGRAPWGIDRDRPFNHLSDFVEKWLEGVYMCHEDICEIISLADHPLTSYNQRSKYSLYGYHWMRHIRFGVEIFATSDTESDCTMHCTWALSLHLYR